MVPAVEVHGVLMLRVIPAYVFVLIPVSLLEADSRDLYEYRLLHLVADNPVYFLLLFVFPFQGTCLVVFARFLNMISANYYYYCKLMFIVKLNLNNELTYRGT